jgi:hypothetical protein
MLEEYTDFTLRWQVHHVGKMTFKYRAEGIQYLRKSTLETDWVSSKTNSKKSSKEIFLECKAARWHYVGKVLYLGSVLVFSFLCEQGYMWEKFQMLHTVAYLCGKWHTFNAALYAWSPTVHKAEKVRWFEVRYVKTWDRIQEQGKEKK